MSALILLRGLPGSGKSTLAKILSENGKYPVFSIDNYFTNPKTGTYIFEHQNNHLAYKQCEEFTIISMQNATEKIFIDNAFTLEWEMEPYFKMVAKYNVDVDSESAYEMLNAKIQEAAENVSVKTTTTTKPVKEEPNAFEKIANNTVVKSMLRTAGNGIVRTLLGSLGLGGRSKTTKSWF